MKVKRTDFVLILTYAAYSMFSASSLIVGLLSLKENFEISIWLVVHGCLCTGYSMLLFIYLLSIPFKLEQERDAYAVFQKRIGSHLKKLNLPPIEDSEEALLYDMDGTEEKKLAYNYNIMIAIFGMFYILSLMTGILLSVVITWTSIKLKVYTVTLLTVSATLSAISIIRVLMSN